MQENIVNVAESQSDIAMRETTTSVEISETAPDEVAVSEALTDDSDKISHYDLKDTDSKDQHLITSITGLREELNEIERLKTIVSDGRGFAEYHLWADGNPLLADGTRENRVGYFVTLVDDTDRIKICTSDAENVFGVIVAENSAAIVGGKLPPNSDGTEADMGQYGLVCVIGSAQVRRMSNVVVGDYVVPNALGMAQKQTPSKYTVIPYHQVIEITDAVNYALTHMPISTPEVYVLKADNTIGNRVSVVDEAVDKQIAIDDTIITVVLGDGGYAKGDRLMVMYSYQVDGSLGYKVTSVGYDQGIYYAKVNLVPNGNALAHCKDEINSIYDRLSVVESNVVIALNRANEAYELAEQGGGSGSGSDGEGGSGDGSGSDSGEDSNISAEIAERLEQIEASLEETREIVDTTSGEIDDVVNEIDTLKEKFEPFDTWTDGQGNMGASYFVKYVNDENIQTRTAIESMEGDIGEANTAISQNALSLQSVANITRKYSVGEHSQAYGLTFDEAQDVLPNDIIYVPYVEGQNDITEEYVAEGGNGVIQTFTEGYSYKWGTDGWEQETENENVYCSGVYVQGSTSVPYWYLASDEDIVYNNITYPKETLYLWNGFNWIAVAALAENSTARAASLINQKANSISLSVKGLDNNLATIQAQVKDNTSRIDLIAASQGDAEALASIKMKSNQNAAEIEYLTSYGFEIIEYDEITEAPTTGTFYATKPMWNGASWSFSGNAVSFDMATNEYRYAENSADTTTYYEYKCLAQNRWRKLLIGRAQSIAAIQQKADANGASIGLLVTDGEVNAGIIVDAINGDSSVKIQAEKVKFEATDYEAIAEHVIFDTQDFKVYADDILFEGEDGSKLTIDADYINFTAEDYKAIADNITFEAPEFTVRADDILFEGEDGSKLTISADNISFTAEDYKAIANEITLDADNINLDGYVTLENLTDGTTTISGSNITTGVIQSSNYVQNRSGFKLDFSDGTVYAMHGEFSGAVTADSGAIGGWTIDGDNGTLSSDGICLSSKLCVATINGITDDYRIVAGSSFGVTRSGKLVASDAVISGTVYAIDGKFEGEVIASSGEFNGKITAGDGEIGGWTIGTNTLSSGNITLSSGRNDATVNGLSGDYRIVAGSNFGVTSLGTLVASSAKISGEINAEDGTIGGWTIGEDSLSSGDIILSTGLVSQPIGGLEGNYRIVAGSNFGVTASGQLVASDAIITGYITATGGTIAGWTINNDNGTLSAGSGANMVAFSAHDAAAYRIIVGNKFSVSKDGALYASDAQITGGSITLSDDSSTLTLQSSYLTYDNGAQKIRISPYGVFFADDIEIKQLGSGCLELLAPDLRLGSSSGEHTLQGTWYYKGSTISGSSRNIKYDIETLSDQYSVLFDNLRPVRFKYKDGQSGRYHTGYILDELKNAMDIAGLETSELAAYCVSDDSTGDGGIRYGEMVALNTMQIQKLKARVVELENQVAQLLGQN